MEDILDKYTLSYINKIIENKKLSLHNMSQANLDFLEGYLEALMWIQEEISNSGSKKK